MRCSKLFANTLRELPRDAETHAHSLMLRASLIRQVASGVYTWLPPGLRVLREIEQIVREEMDAAGAQELHALHKQQLQQHAFAGAGRAAEQDMGYLRQIHRYPSEYAFPQDQYKSVFVKIPVFPVNDLRQFGYCGGGIQQNAPFAPSFLDRGDIQVERGFNFGLFVLPFHQGDAVCFKFQYRNSGVVFQPSFRKQVLMNRKPLSW